MKNNFSMERRAFLGNVSKVGLLSFFPLGIAGKEELPNDDEKEHAFLTEPYLQCLTPEQVTVMWISSKNSLHWVEINEPGEAPSKIVNATHGLINANNSIAKLKVNGLKPGTNYQYCVFSKEIKLFEPYRVEYGPVIQNGPFHFTTPSLESDGTKFVVLNDTHENPDNITELIEKLTVPDDYDFVAFNGDTFHWIDGEERILNALLSPVGKAFSPQKPFLMVQGNHEARGKYARQFFQYFDYPDERCYYAFTQGPVRLIILDSGEDKEDNNVEYSGLVAFDAYREEQAKWLAKEIKSDGFKHATFKVVLMHISPFHSGDWHGTMHCRKLFAPLLNEGKIDLAISGHRHRYGVFDPDQENHNYPIVIGGGSGTASRQGGQRTLIKVKATQSSLSLQMLVDDGSMVGSYEINK